MDVANLITGILQTILAAIGLLQNYYIFVRINQEHKMKLRDDEQMQTWNYDSYGRHLERISGSILAQAGTNSHADTRSQSTPDYDNSLFYERPGRTMSGETMIAQETSWPKPSGPKYGDDDVKPILNQPRIRTNDISATYSICSPSQALVYGSRQPS